jgi:hypothetical protein
LQGVVKLNVTGVGDARRARRSTINAGGRNRIPEMAVG